MIYGDDSYKKKLDMIAAIPSNKFDEVNLKNLSDEAMRESDKRHLRELTEQASNMDAEEQVATAAGLNIAVLYNAIGDYIKRQELKAAKIDEANEI